MNQHKNCAGVGAPYLRTMLISILNSWATKKGNF